MVATKPAKLAKYSYTERVLGAFTTVQKEHRRHVVHIATLRAQVKKTAQGKLDKLGPQWSNWVGKAVHKLESEGILAPGEASGSLTLTPIGKNAIAAARQSLSIPQHAIPTSAEEDLIWKQVSQPTSITSRGTKRARRSSDPHLSRNGEQHGEPSRPTSIQLKRPRISVLTGQQVEKPTAKMTKTELLAKLHATQKAHEEALWRATSPLTDLSDDDSEEVVRLKAQLEQQEGVIAELRHALAQSVPRLEITDTVPVPHGVTRTQSGSFISTLSKRPTPEPSTPEPMDDHRAPFGDSMTYDHDANGMQEHDRGPSYPLATPAISPVFPTDQDTQESVNKMTKLERSLAARVLDVRKLEGQLLDLQTECSTAVQNLSRSDGHIKALQAEIITVENQVSELQAAKNDLEVSLTFDIEERDRIIQERNASISTLEAEGENYLAQLADLQDKLSQAEATATSHATQASIAENETAALRSALGAAETSNSALVDKQKVKDAELQEHLTNISQLEQQIGEFQACKDRLTETVTSMSEESSSISEKLQRAETSNEYLSNQLASTMNENITLQAAWATSKDDLLQRDAIVEKISESLTYAQEETAVFRNEIGTLKLSILTLDNDLGVSKEASEELTKKLAMIAEERADLAVQLENAKKTITSTNLSLEEAREKFSVVESAAKKFQVEAKANEVEVQGLRLQFTAAQNQASAAADQLLAAQTSHAQESATRTSMISDLEQRLETTRADLQLQLQKRGAQLMETKLYLEAEQKRSSDLENNFNTATRKVQEAEDELSEIRESKEADERTIESLKEMFTTLRETQMRSFAEIDNKVISVHASPTPKRRSARNAGKVVPFKLT